ncbi:MAG: glycosyltransferase family 87 protein [Pseudomonadota bacterium]
MSAVSHLLRENPAVDAGDVPVLRIGIALACAVTLCVLLTGAGGASTGDFAAFQRAGAMAAAGDAAGAYDPAAFRAGLEPDGAALSWRNPPHAFLALAPLSSLPDRVAALLWMAAIVASSAAIGALAVGSGSARRRAAGALATALSPAALADALVWQTGPFAALALFIALSAARTRPILAGVLLAMVTMKPHYAFIAPVALAAFGAWRAIAAFALATLGFVAASIACFGLAPWFAYAAAAADVFGGHAGALHRDLLTAQQTAAKLGFGSAAGTAAPIAAIGAGAALAWGAMRARRAGRLPARAAVGLALLGGALAGPSFWVHDWAICMAALIAIASSLRLSQAAQAAGAALWAAPLVALGAATLASSVAVYACLVAATALLARGALCGEAGQAVLDGGAGQAVASNNSRPISMRRISDVPAPIS